MKTMKPVALAILGAALVAAPSAALAQDAAIEGMIVSRSGSTVVVRSGGVDTPVTIDDSAKIRGVSGLFDLERTPHPPSDLIRGLAVKVKTNEDGETSVTFKERDFKTAQQIAAGVAVTETNVASNAAGISRNASSIASNSDRINNVGELVSAGRAKVFFALGSSAINEEGQQALQGIAAQAKAIPGYRLVVVGRADPTGDAASNQRLSEARADAVTSYLVKSAGVTPDRILPPTGLGESEVVQDPDPATTPEEGRRVTVTIAVSKALASR
jgi:outer membrane protein OmpA-like peptidoglycan-associated protein